MDAVERLGELLRTAGFGGARSTALVGEGGVLPPVESLTAFGRTDDARLAVLLKLFAQGRAIDRPQAEHALAPLALDDLVAAGLIAIDGSVVRSRLQLGSFEGLILAGDPTSEGTNTDFVSPVTLASRFTARLTVRRDVETALDLGTGSGVQALLATRHARHVVGVDINAHALSMAGLSQRLSGVVDGVSWLEGSWLEPVRGQTFDLVVANPPFVISPDNAYLYRDTEAAADELSRQVVRECAAALTDGGFATVMCSWIHPDGDWESPVREWVAGLGCDALLLHHSSEDPLAYAIAWNRDLAAHQPEEFTETVGRWTSHYQRVGMERIATGFIVLRRRSGDSSWVQPFQGVGVPGHAGGDHVERMFAAGDFFSTHAGAGQLQQLLARPWRLLEGHRLDQSATYRNGAYAGEAQISCQPDMGVRSKVDPRVLPVLVGCDGRRPLGQLIEQTPVPADLDRSGFHSLCLNVVRDLIARGYLLGDALEEM